MSEQEMNRAIYDELLKVARSFFQQIKSYIQVGSYTANQVDEAISPIIYTISSAVNDEKATVKVGTFKCTFPKVSVFSILHKFYKLAKVKDKERPYFIREDQDQKEVLLSFDINVPKYLKYFAFVCDQRKDDYFNSLKYIAIDPNEKVAVATDRYKIYVNKIELENIEGSMDYMPVISPDAWKQYCGNKIHISVIKSKDSIFCYSSSEKYQEKVEYCKYPNYKKVIFYSEEGKLSISKTDAANIIKSIRKQGKENEVYFYAETGSKILHVKVTTPDFEKEIVSFEAMLDNPMQWDFSRAIRLERLHNIKWDGGLYYAGQQGLLFDCSDNDIAYICSCEEGSLYENIKLKDKDLYKIITANPHLEKTCDLKKILSRKQKTIKAPAKEPDNTIMGYEIEKLESGNYLTAEGGHDEELKHVVRSIAHYLRQNNDMQLDAVEYFKKRYGTTRDWQSGKRPSSYPLPEEELAMSLVDFLETKGIEEVPDYPARQIDMRPKVKAGSIPAKKEVLPILTVDSPHGKLTVAAESYLEKLYDEQTERFISQKARDTFDRIDAFIPDKLVYQRPLDKTAILKAVEAFYQEVESAV